MTRPHRAFLQEFRSHLDRVDTVLLRRAGAVALLVLAALLALRPDPAAGRTEVLVAARDLPPGQVLGEGDLHRAPRETATLPAGAVRDAGTLRGATLAGALAAGEIVTELRVVGPRLAAVAAHEPDARIVPIRLADNAVAEILRAGDRVDVVAGEDTGQHGRPARLLAADAAVVLVSGAENGPGTGNARGRTERVVLVALDSRRATAVAAASLHSALTVVFH
ncbi:RcpC/CpaB family pilus assembly protein [Nocardia seriolae]|nr:RcpC/CpaB family pilus assembly protein [Nocardia seriolae]MTJ66261.1 flagellar biosynthesis protein FlgA [Nocardia seriolae]MTJ69917.1 flagellar biosynthesis protein FlgA [Nocardia seriolae]MTJ85826.1 flagellar biosynthesis protein FlgA [Nocardia seriolae]MTK29822.1 flagellar biosynthesis protein FlgA [Nocardia seriolae]MTK44254.1 flagellar biosynthesis protein FlgA [Nocardia seriolae]